MPDEVTRSEFNLLVSQVSEDRARMNSIDNSETRAAVGIVQAQLMDVTKDLTELKTDVNTKFASHLRDHEIEKRDRISARRWLVGIGVAGIASMTAVITLLVELLNKVH